MKKIVFTGACSAIPIPFNSSGVNYTVLRDFINFQLKNSIDAIVVCGTSGESATMSFSEKLKVISFVVDVVNHKVPVIAGTGSNNTLDAIELTKKAEQLGVDSVLVVTPFYNKTSQAGLVKHYSAIADSTSLPIILYNVPSRTGLNISPDTCFELSKISNIVAIKEASGDISQITKIRQLCDDDFNIYSGNDDQIIPILSIGGIGVISVLSNVVPNFVHDMVFDYLNGNIYDALNKELLALPFINSLFCDVNPIPLKYAMNKIGFDYGIPRLPLIEISLQNKKLIDSEFYKLLKNIS
jgi:4-hydroxy-tetrahydrodipicolinate synthase